MIIMIADGRKGIVTIANPLTEFDIEVLLKTSKEE